MRRRCVLAMPVCAATACGGDPPVADAGVDGARPDSAAPACTHVPGVPDEVPNAARYTPRRAFEPWISKDISHRADTLTFVQGFLDRDIPIGAVVLDSPWETQYDTFQSSKAHAVSARGRS